MKSRFVILLAGLAACCAVSQATADGAHETCIQASGADLAACGDAWLKREQASLDIGWQAMLAQTSGAVRDALVAEQAAWTIYSDKACAFMRDPVFAPGGDLATFYTCRAGVIADRAREVTAYTSYVDN
jgi:uncharacterized protein YecT (DUF1311 family)